MLRNNHAISSIISTVILTSVLIVITVTSSFFANQTLTTNIQNVQFEQGINTILSTEKIVRNLMFKPYATGSVQTSFPATYPYIDGSGTISVLVNEIEQTSFPEVSFRILGGSYVGVPIIKNYVGNDTLMLIGFGGTLSRVHTFQSNGAWVSLDYDRIRVVYSGVAEFYNGVGFELYNIVEVTAVRLVSGDITAFERARVIIENLGVEATQLERTGNPTIKVQLSGREETVNLVELGGHIDYPTLINLAVVTLQISILGSG